MNNSKVIPTDDQIELTLVKYILINFRQILLLNTSKKLILVLFQMIKRIKIKIKFNTQQFSYLGGYLSIINLG